MTTIIFFGLLGIVVIWGSYFIYCMVDNDKEQKSAAPTDTNILIQLEKRHNRFTVWDNRRKRRSRVWSVLYLCNSFHKIEERTKNNHCPTKKMLKDLANAKEYVLEYKPTPKDISMAIRYCQIKYASNQCDYKLTTSDINQIYAIDKLAELPPPIELW